MEGAFRTTALTWTNSISPSSLHIPQAFSKLDARRLGVCCASDQTQKANKMTVAVTGATGFIGRRLVQTLHADNHYIHFLTRSTSKAELIFPAERDWKKSIEGSNAVVNLAGLPISRRWSSEIKKEIKQSRIRVTSKVVDLINHSPEEIRPTVLVSATAVGFYGSSETQVFDESSPSGNDYPAEVCREWEATALKVNKDVRVALIRIAVVLGKDGGALAKLIPLFMMFAGGPLGSGRQWFSWIHLDDIVNLIYEALVNPSYKGTYFPPFMNAKLGSQVQGLSCLVKKDGIYSYSSFIIPSSIPLPSSSSSNSLKLIFMIINHLLAATANNKENVASPSFGMGLKLLA